MSIVIAILVFSLVIIVHEIGHFAAARASGVLVEEFAIGMGPRLFSFTRGETVYSLRAFPLGGSCRMLGEDADNRDARAFNSKSIPKRFAILAAGAAMNFVLAFVLYLAFTAGHWFYVPVVHDVADNSPAQAAGLQAGDRIVRANKQSINIHADYSLAVSDQSGEPITLEILRNGEKRTLAITPQRNEAGTRYVIGITWRARLGLFYPESEMTDEIRAEYARAGMGETIAVSFYNTLYATRLVFHGLANLFTGQASVNDFSGLIGIVVMVDDIQTQSVEVGGVSLAVWNMVQFAALLSANIGLFNLLPVPALDGARIVFLLIEGIRRKPVPPEREGMVHFIGFVLLMALAVFIAYNDIVKLFVK